MVFMFASKTVFVLPEVLQGGEQEGGDLQPVRTDASNHRDRLRHSADQDSERREFLTSQSLL